MSQFRRGRIISTRLIDQVVALIVSLDIEPDAPPLRVARRQLMARFVGYRDIELVLVAIL